MIKTKYLIPTLTVILLFGCSTSPYSRFGNPTLEQVLNEHAEKVQSLPKDSATNEKDEKQHLEDMYQEWIVLKPKLEKIIALEAELKATNNTINELKKTQLTATKSVKQKPNASVNSLPYKYTMQIGASTSLESAQKFWLQQQKKYPDLLNSVTPTIQHIKKGNKDFYRVQVGKYKARKKAEKDCATFSNIGGQCLIRKL